MAKVKFSALISDMRNKLNGSVFSKNRAGSYLRNKVTPVNPQTSFQTAVRAILTAASQSWRTISAANRLAWNNAVIGFTGTDIFGDIKTPSGINLYNKLYINASTIAGTPLVTPPGLVSSPGVPAVSVATAAPGTFTVNGVGIVAVPANQSFVVRATPSVSAGKAFLKGKDRIIAVLASGTALPYAGGADYTGKFGNMVVGEKVGWVVEAIDETTFVKGPQISGANIN